MPDCECVRIDILREDSDDCNLQTEASAENFRNHSHREKAVLADMSFFSLLTELRTSAIILMKFQLPMCKI